MLELTKKRVAKIIEVLRHPDGLNDKVTIEQVFETLIQISNPIEFEGKTREQALKRLMDLFHMNIWYIFGKPGIPDFGGRYTQELN